MHGNVEIRDPRFSASSATLVTFEKLATGFLFTEGPLWHATDKYLLFSDMPGDHLRKWTRARRRHHVPQALRAVERPRLGPAGPADRVRARDQHRSRAPKPDGRSTVIASHHDGKELNSPNDVVVKIGRRHLLHRPDLWPQRILRQSAPAAARLPRRLSRRAGRRQLTLLADDFGQPNGLCFSLRRAAAVRQRHRAPAHPRVRREAGRHAGERPRLGGDDGRRARARPTA